jgi:hypothetical protein
MNKTIKIIFLLITLFILITSCDKNTKPDTTPPNVTITNPQNGSVVFEYVPINCVATDNEEIDYVELWVDGVSTDSVDNTEPYSINWNTSIYEDGTYHTITVRAYDESDNVADSEPITVCIDNTLAFPTPVELYPIYHNQGSFTITCSQNNDDDFSSYEFYESFNEDMSSSNLIFETINRTDTTCIVTGISLDEIRFYQVVVKDYGGLESFSNIEFGKGCLGLYINEFLASNDTCFPDEHGDYDDWIEIYNGGIEAIDIGGMYLTDNLSYLMNSQIPSTNPDLTTIYPGEFLILWADKEPEQGILHLDDIKLYGGGEDIALTASDGTTIIDSYTFGEQTADVSEGRFPDGYLWEFFTIPTPGASNN